MTMSLRERQAPLKERYRTDPTTAISTITVRSTTAGTNPTRVQITQEHPGGASWEIGAHALAGGEGDLACSGDLLLAGLAACQEVTLRMVAAAMGIELRQLQLSVTGEMDFRGTMGIDPETPVGFQRITTDIVFDADAPQERLQKLVERADRYCVVSATLRQPPEMTLNVQVGGASANRAE